jgi:predicted nucleic acid-binding Zn ribbon protein
VSALKRLLSAPRFRLKGQGWYETDFKKDNQRNLHGEKEPSKSKDKPASDKDGDKSTSKPSSDKKTDTG